MSRPLRVLHVIKSLGLGGAERLLVDGAKVAADLDLRHDVVSFLPHKDALIPQLRAAGVRVTVLAATTSAGVLARAPDLARHIAVMRPDVVHAHLPVASVAARLACAQARVPCVSTEHNVLERYHTLTRALSLSTWSLQACVVACSDEVARSIDRFMPPRHGRPAVVTVHNGVPVDRFARVDEADVAAVRAALGLQPSDQLIGTVCVLRAQKALDRFLRVAQAVRSTHPRARFVVVGDGPERARLDDCARALGVADVVRFVGLQPEPAPWLAAMDVWLSTSSFEGLPIALLEALAARRPVVVTAVGGVPEVVTDTFNGRLLRPEDESGLADAVRRYLDNGALAQRHAEAGRALVERRFGVVQMQGRLRRVYEDVLSARVAT